MKIAIASIGDKEDSMVSGIFGRAPYFLLFENGELIKSIKNPFVAGGGGAGYGSARMLANEGVKIVVCSKVGEKAKVILDEEKIEFRALGEVSVAQAVKMLNE